MRTYIITWVLHCDSNKVATANKQLSKASAQVRVSTCNADKLPLMQTQMEEGRSWTAWIVKPSSLNLDFSSTNLHLLDTIPSMLLLAMYHLLVLIKNFCCTAIEEVVGKSIKMTVGWDTRPFIVPPTSQKAIMQVVMSWRYQPGPEY